MILQTKNYTSVNKLVVNEITITGDENIAETFNQ